jgi:Protein of unknown function (DUF2723)
MKSLRWRALHAREALYPLAIGLAALALYLVTLQPDFGGPEDAPKFQFVGYVLGTAHAPGYPLYVLLSHLFVMLPIRTIAYRANLFSAVMAALACVLAYVIARQIGSTRVSAACAALALATGASFWRNALFAEVYSLAAVMVALTIALLLAWSARGGTARLLAAVAAFGLGLGNHLTIVGLVPASILFVLWRDRHGLTARGEMDVARCEINVAQPFRAAPAAVGRPKGLRYERPPAISQRTLSLKVVVAAAVILLLCISQYGFIILRTWQQAPYLESSARSLSELSSVLTAQRFANQRFAFGPVVLLTVQLPMVLSVIGRELGILGASFLAAGVIEIVRRRNAAAGLVVGAALGLLAMVVNLSGDLKGFITPIVVLLWPLVALGVDALAHRLVRHSAGREGGSAKREGGRVVRAAVGVLAAAAMAVIPVANIAANYSEVDRSSQTEEGRFFRSLYAQLPARSAIVAEDYFFDMALIYYMVTGEGGPNRGIGPIVFNAGVVHEAARTGHRVFAFGRAAAFFGAQGLSFERAAVPGPTLAEWLRTLPRGTVIVGAAAYSAMPLELSTIDRRTSDSMRTYPFTVFALATQRSGRTMRQADDGVSLAVDGATLTPLLPPLPGALTASANDRGARVQLSGRTIAAVDSGLALAVFNPDGTLWRTLEFRSGDPLRVEPEAAVYEFKGDAPCVEITTDRWTDVAPVLSTGSWLATVPAVGSVTIESELPESCAAPNATVDEMLSAGAARQVSRTPNADGTLAVVTELTRNVYGRPLFRMALHCPASRARARVQSGGMESTVTMCAHRQPPLFPAGTERAAIKADFEAEPYFGAGWHDSERIPTGRVRRADDRATLLLPLATGYSYQISLDLAAAAPIRIDAALNGAPVGGCEIGGQGSSCDVTVPSGIVQDGVNALTLTAVRLPSAAARPVAAQPWICQGARIVRRSEQR